jgi:hypothetical protein
MSIFCKCLGYCNEIYYQYILRYLIENKVDIDFQYSKGYANAENIHECILRIAEYDMNCQKSLFSSQIPDNCINKLKSILNGDIESKSYGKFRSQIGLLGQLTDMKLFYEKYQIEKIDEMLLDIYEVLDHEDIHTKFRVILVIENILKHKEPTNGIIDLIEYILKCNEICYVRDGDDIINYPTMLSILTKSIVGSKFSKKIIIKLKDNEFVMDTIKNMVLLYETENVKTRHHEKSYLFDDWDYIDGKYIDNSCVDILNQIKHLD